ncbi:MAG: serine hydroxymethyltransferase [Minisyncoccia bacterium]
MKDKQIEKLINAEEARQRKNISLIASENYVSDDVLLALGSKFTNKYSEGYPGKRYYKGQTFTDKIEELCWERALKLFKLSKEKWAVNAQALSGSPANLAVYVALVPQGGKVMGMSLDHGGHLTHGHKVSATGKFWTQIPYGVNKDTEVLDYEEIKKLAIAEKPNMIIVGYTAYPRIVDFKKFREIADACPNIDSNGRACGAILMVDMSHFAGLVAGEAYPSPFPYADVVTTTVHKTLRGPRSALIFARKDKTQTSAKGNQISFADLIDKAIFPGLQGGPHMNQIAAVAVALKEASTPAFKKYAKQVIKNAQVLSSELKKLGWKIISGGTDSHLILVDTWMSGKGMSGAEASEKLEKVGIIVNKNTIPNETRTPFDPSGIRLGTAGETTRGAKEKDMIKLAKRIDSALKA